MSQAKSIATKPIASLSPTLLARKGGARPAIRSAQAEIAATDDAAATPGKTTPAKRSRKQAGAKVVALDSLRIAASPAAATNAVRRQQAQLAEKITGKARAARPAAFTLRLDGERHLQLRLAAALTGRSGQNLVVEALDTMLASLPGLAQAASRAGKHR